jgi:hypothetical protein
MIVGALRRSMHTIVILSSWSTATGSDLAPLSSAELHAQCLAYARAPTSTEGQLCEAYLRAFVEGSDQIRFGPAKDANRDESFTARALRTRYGSHALPRSRYCVNSSVTANDLIMQLLVQAESMPPDKNQSAATLIYATVNRYHRCNAGVGSRRAP